MNQKKCLATLLVIFGFIYNNNGANILGVFPLHGKSHYQMFGAFMKGLAEKGHNVDVISHFPQQKPIARLRDISMAGTIPMLLNNVSLTHAPSGGIWGTMIALTDRAGTQVCEALFGIPEIDKVYEDLKNKKYDVLITEIFGTDCALALAGDHGIPTVGMVSSFSMPWANDRFGNVDNPAYIPNIFLSFDGNMDFFQRLVNTFIQTMCKILYYYKSTLVSEDQVQKKFGEHSPSVETLQNNMSLLLLNSHYSLSGARPLSPNAKEVAGLHIQPTGKLPVKYEKIMNDAKKGVIFFTMGSMVRTDTFPLAQKHALIDAFAELSDYTVIWKGNKSAFPEPIPKNIHFGNWLPQLEILCHPKTKAFLTHGGLMGSLEACHCGVPLVGMPVFGDQHMNIKNFIKKGFATVLDYKQLTKENVLTALKTVLDNPSYMEQAKYFSNLFRDRPISAMDEAIYWVEYVIRHKGAPQLKPSSVNLAWYQLYLFDIALFVIVSIIIVISIIYLLVVKIYKITCTKKNQKKIKTK